VSESNAIRAGGALVAGVGNPMRGDDGAGPQVARQIAGLDMPGITVTEHHGEGASLMELWRGWDHVYIVDATSSGAEPGAIVRIDAQEQAVPSRFFNYSTHAFSVAEAVELARRLGMLPPHLVLYGIEGASFGAGQDLTPSVAAAAGRVCEQLLQELGAMREGQPETKPCMK
jgi:hydrogenase maturation protease